MGKKKEEKKAKKQEKKEKKLGKAAKEQQLARASELAELGVDMSAGEPKPKLKRKEFEAAMEPLQVELVKLQEWVKHTGAKICILFEGRDAAGKGGIIKRMTERTSPRVFRVVALPAPSDREKSQMYIQRYLPHLPAAGEIVLFDRSWYNRAGVERVMGFAPEEQVESFLKHHTCSRTSHYCLGSHPHQVLARSEHGKSDRAI